MDIPLNFCSLDAHGLTQMDTFDHNDPNFIEKITPDIFHTLLKDYLSDIWGMLRIVCKEFKEFIDSLPNSKPLTDMSLVFEDYSIIEYWYLTDPDNCPYTFPSKVILNALKKGLPREHSDRWQDSVIRSNSLSKILKSLVRYDRVDLLSSLSFPFLIELNKFHSNAMSSEEEWISFIYDIIFQSNNSKIFEFLERELTFFKSCYLPQDHSLDNYPEFFSKDLTAPQSALISITIRYHNTLKKRLHFLKNAKYDCLVRTFQKYPIFKECCRKLANFDLLLMNDFGLDRIIIERDFSSLQKIYQTSEIHCLLELNKSKFFASGWKEAIELIGTSTNGKYSLGLGTLKKFFDFSTLFDFISSSSFSDIKTIKQCIKTIWKLWSKCDKSFENSKLMKCCTLELFEKTKLVIGSRFLKQYVKNSINLDIVQWFYYEFLNSYPTFDIFEIKDSLYLNKLFYNFSSFDKRVQSEIIFILSSVVLTNGDVYIHDFKDSGLTFKKFGRFEFNQQVLAHISDSLFNVACMQLEHYCVNKNGPSFLIIDLLNHIRNFRPNVINEKTISKIWESSQNRHQFERLFQLSFPLPKNQSVIWINVKKSINVKYLFDQIGTKLSSDYVCIETFKSCERWDLYNFCKFKKMGKFFYINK